MNTLSIWAIPLFILAVLAYGEYKGVKVYETFIQGAGTGLKTGFELLPYFLAIFGALAVFKTSGALNFFCRVAAPFANLLRIPEEILPLGLIKPLSGSGSIGFMADLIQKHGPDSPLGIMASIIAGGSETTFYVLSVYLGAAKITRPKHLVGMGLLGDLTAFFMAVLITRWFQIG
ncbi:MAG TPA: spore maturation protein [Firmicutes bacterium]|jgi:spore maturation protein B|nr:spore maturation protein [Bacillota bacterium]